MAQVWAQKPDGQLILEVSSVRIDRDLFDPTHSSLAQSLEPLLVSNWLVVVCFVSLVALHCGRAYYRCAGRMTCGCSVKKTVDFPILKGLDTRITYSGEHNHPPESAACAMSNVVVQYRSEKKLRQPAENMGWKASVAHGPPLPPPLQGTQGPHHQSLPEGAQFHQGPAPQPYNKGFQGPHVLRQIERPQFYQLPQNQSSVEFPRCPPPSAYSYAQGPQCNQYPQSSHCHQVPILNQESQGPYRNQGFQHNQDQGFQHNQDQGFQHNQDQCFQRKQDPQCCGPPAAIHGRAIMPWTNGRPQERKTKRSPEDDGAVWKVAHVHHWPTEIPQSLQTSMPRDASHAANNPDSCATCCNAVVCEPPQKRLALHASPISVQSTGEVLCGKHSHLQVKKAFSLPASLMSPESGQHSRAATTIPQVPYGGSAATLSTAHSCRSDLASRSLREKDHESIGLERKDGFVLSPCTTPPQMYPTGQETGLSVDLELKL